MHLAMSGVAGAVNAHPFVPHAGAGVRPSGPAISSPYDRSAAPDAVKACTTHKVFILRGPGHGEVSEMQVLGG